MGSAAVTLSTMMAQCNLCHSRHQIVVTPLEVQLLLTAVIGILGRRCCRVAAVVAPIVTAFLLLSFSMLPRSSASELSMPSSMMLPRDTLACRLSSLKEEYVGGTGRVPPATADPRPITGANIFLALTVSSDPPLIAKKTHAFQVGSNSWPNLYISGVLCILEYFYISLAIALVYCYIVVSCISPEYCAYRSTSISAWLLLFFTVILLSHVFLFLQTVSVKRLTHRKLDAKLNLTNMRTSIPGPAYTGKSAACQIEFF